MVGPETDPDPCRVSGLFTGHLTRPLDCMPAAAAKNMPMSSGTYLETTYEVANGKELIHRLKNANETESKIWRYHHYNSRLDYTTKRAILFSTLRKVHKMASNSKQLHISATAKCKEYIKLHYPVGILKYMCSIMARETANHIWLQVRREL